MTERQAQDAQNLISSYRAAAAAFPAVRRVIERFSGKCYSKRLTDALKEEIGEAGYIYAEKSGRYVTINFFPRGARRWHAIASVNIDDALPDGKRINSGAIMDSLRETRADMLRRAFEIDEAGKNLDVIQARLGAIARELSAVLDPISYEVRDVYDIHFFMRY